MSCHTCGCETVNSSAAAGIWMCTGKQLGKKKNVREQNGHRTGAHKPVLSYFSGHCIQNKEAAIRHILPR